MSDVLTFTCNPNLPAGRQVQKRWGFKAALFLIQEMRAAKLEISLVHYRGAVTACSLTRQLAGVLPLLEEMRDRGIAADVATYNAAISACTHKNVRVPPPQRPRFFSDRDGTWVPTAIGGL